MVTGDVNIPATPTFPLSWETPSANRSGYRQLNPTKDAEMTERGIRLGPGNVCQREDALEIY